MNEELIAVLAARLMNRLPRDLRVHLEHVASLEEAERRRRPIAPGQAASMTDLRILIIPAATRKAPS